MNANRSFGLFGFIALALLAISLAPTCASAQAFRGKFTLPFQARWRGLVLPAGDYSFSIDSLTPAGMIAVQRDGKNMGSVMVGSVSYHAPSNDSALVAVPAGEVRRISVLRLENECTIDFPTPKNEQQISNREPELSLVVPISKSRV